MFPFVFSELRWFGAKRTQAFSQKLAFFYLPSGFELCSSSSAKLKDFWQCFTPIFIHTSWRYLVEGMTGGNWVMKGVVPLSSLHFNWTTFPSSPMTNRSLLVLETIIQEVQKISERYRKNGKYISWNISLFFVLSIKY